MCVCVRVHRHTQRLCVCAAYTWISLGLRLSPRLAPSEVFCGTPEGRQPHPPFPTKGGTTKENKKVSVYQRVRTCACRRVIGGARSPHPSFRCHAASSFVNDCKLVLLWRLPSSSTLFCALKSSTYRLPLRWQVVTALAQAGWMNDGDTCTDNTTKLFTPTHRERSRLGKEGGAAGRTSPKLSDSLPPSFTAASFFSMLFSLCVLSRGGERGGREGWMRERGADAVSWICVSPLSYPQETPCRTFVLLFRCWWTRVGMRVCMCRCLVCVR